MLWIYFLFLIALVNVQACGMSTHISVSHRAIQMFDVIDQPSYSKLLSSHLGALQAGAPAPDWGYACGYHDVGEYTHWEPFQRVAVEYVLEKYPKPWSEDVSKLVSFLFGIGSHSVADMNWHGLSEASPRWEFPGGLGFIETMGGLEFNCNGTLCEPAHSTADTGGEFVVDATTNRDFMQWDWYVPTQDLLDIYARVQPPLNINASAANDIVKCFAEFYAAVHAEPLVAKAMMLKYAAASPYLATQIEDRFLGGVDDMAIWTNIKWTQLENWFDHGVPPPPVINNSMPLAMFQQSDFAQLVVERVRELQSTSFLSSSPKSSSLIENMPSRAAQFVDKVARARLADVSVHRARVEAVIEYSKARGLLSENSGISELVQVKETNRGHLFRFRPDVHKNHNTLLKPEVRNVANSTSELVDAVRASVQLCSTGSTRDCIVHAIRNQSWYQPIGENNVLPRDPIASIDAGGSAFQYFGHSVCVGDFDHDGLQDIAIGQPGSSAPNAPQHGSITIMYRLKSLSSDPQFQSVILSGTATYQRFGWALATVDLNQDGIDDLVVSMPTAQGEFVVQNYTHDVYRGQVQVFLGRSEVRLMSSSTADVSINGNDHEHFATIGHVLQSGDLNHDGFADLIIASPHAFGGNGEENQPNENFLQRGLVAVIFSRQQQWSSAFNINSADWIYRGETDYEFAGASLFVLPGDKPSQRSPVLIIGCPGYSRSTGRVLGFSGFDSPSGAFPLFSVTGPSALSNFGQSISAGYFFTASPSDSGWPLSGLSIAISAHTENTDSSLHVQAGTVRILDASQLLNGGKFQISDLKIQTMLVGTVFGRLGYQITAARMNRPGSGLVHDLLVGEGTASTLTNFEAGQIRALFGGSTFPVGNVTSPFTEDWYGVGTSLSSRVGTVSPVQYDWNLDGHFEWLVGVPRATGTDPAANTQQGKVFVWSNLK